MKEIEILSSLEEEICSAQEKIQSFVFSNGDTFKFKGEKRIIDTYFKSNAFNDLDPDKETRLKACLRLRQKGNESFLTYKNDIFDNHGVWMYSDETETKVEDIKSVAQILKMLHFENLVTIDNQRIFYENKDYEIVIENVLGLGNFVEIEYKTDEEINQDQVDRIQTEIRTLVADIGLIVSEELHAGKPELMLKKSIL